VNALADKHEIIVFDSLGPQVHASKHNYPQSIFGDVKDKEGLIKEKDFFVYTLQSSMMTFTLGYLNYSPSPYLAVTFLPTLI